MSQPVEPQPARTGHPVAAGVMIIVSACLLIVVNLLNIVTMYGYPYMILWRELPIWLGYITFDLLAVAGGVLALTRTSLLFAIFSASLLIPTSFIFVASYVESLVLGENILAISPLIIAIFTPVALVLSILSVIFLAQSKSEFR